MELYREYVKERLGREMFLVKDVGFATYEIDLENQDCYIVDIFVKESHRRSGIAWQIVDEISKIAKNLNCKTLTGSIDLRAKNPEIITQAHFAYGFRFYGAEKHILVLKKDI